MSEEARPRLVFAACRAPFPLENGGRIRTHNLLSGLAQAFDTRLVTFEHHPDSPDGHCGADELRELYPELEVVTVPGAGAGKRGSQARSLLTPRSWTNGRYQSPAFSAALREAAASSRPCVVHFDDLGVAQAGRLDGAVNVYSSHNIEQRILGLGTRVGSVPARAFNAVEALKVRAEERRVWRSMDISLAVSELDAAVMRAGGARRVLLCPNGAPPVELLPLPSRAAEQPLKLLFVGSGSYAPYERGLAWFVREVLPRARETTPVELDVIGQPPQRPVHADGVRYLGRVPSVEPHYRDGHGVVIPVFEGSGTRLKMLEAMAFGRPVIATALGAEGLPASAGREYLEADDPAAFAAACVRLAEWSAGSDRDELEHMVTAAREAVEPLFWSSIAEDLGRLYRGELDALREGAAGGRRPVPART